MENIVESSKSAWLHERDLLGKAKIIITIMCGVALPVLDDRRERYAVVGINRLLALPLLRTALAFCEKIGTLVTQPDAGRRMCTSSDIFRVAHLNSDA